MFESLSGEIGSDASGSFADHLSLVGKVTLLAAGRLFRSGSRGFFPWAGLRFSDRMLGIFSGEQPVVGILPIGHVYPEVISDISRVVWEVYGLPVRIMRRREPWPQSFDPIKSSIDGNAVLSDLEELRSSEGDSIGRIIAVTRYQLTASQTEQNTAAERAPVHGFAALAKPVAIVSTHHLGWDREDPLLKLPWSNLLKVTIHELGHTFGIGHCQSKGCIMNMVPIGGVIDLPQNFCDLCYNELTGKQRERH